MSSELPIEPGQLSPDGLWRWDGAQWVPVAAGAPRMTPPRRSRAWIGWLAGGCAVLIVLAVIGGGFGLYSLVKRVQNGDFNCLPSDFPNYPGTTIAGENVTLSATKHCSITLESNDGVAAVTSFYQQGLNTGDWTITSSDPANGEFQFQLRSRPQTAGTISFLGKGQHTEIQIELTS